MTDLPLILVFTLHLLAVNVATAGPFVCLWLEWRETRHGDELAGRVARDLVRWILRLLALGMVLGFVTLWLLWLKRPQYLDVLCSLPGLGVYLGISERVWSAMAEVAIFALTMWAYLACWKRFDFRRWSHRWGHRAIGWFGALNILYHVPPLFAVAAVVNERPQLLKPNVKFVHLMYDTEVLARILHGWLAAAAVTGVALAVYAWRQSSAWKAEDVRRVVLWGSRIALAATLLQLAAGSFLTLVIPAWSRDLVMGGDPLGTGLFGLALLASFALMHQLGATALGDTERRAVVKSAVLMTTVVLLMVGVRHRMRGQERPATAVRANVTLAQQGSSDRTGSVVAAFPAE